MLRIYVLDQRQRLCGVRSRSLGGDHPNRHALRIDRKMHLGIQPPFVRPISWFPLPLPPRVGEL